MAYVIGTDEAGYGPNLGPLVVSASLWQVPDDCRAEDIYGRLAPLLTDRAASEPAETGVVVIADSKRLYTPAGGLGLLESGLLTMLGQLHARPPDWRAVWQQLEPDAQPDEDLPWHHGYLQTLPLAADSNIVADRVAAVEQVLASRQIRLLAVRSRTVFPARFNALVEEHGNKATALSHVSIGLMAELISPHAQAPAQFVCDKHGGRNRYAPLLQAAFPDWLVEVLEEGRQQSRYRFGPPGGRYEVCFRTGAEAVLPVALASMASKYLRELLMRPFNAFWCQRQPGLRPTAGYPVDARRFKREIAALQHSLGIDDSLLWRNR